jgi:hypothetical protein
MQKSWKAVCGVGIFILLAAITVPAQAKSSARTVKGPTGQLLTVSATNVKNGQAVTVTGKKYNQKLGIYLAFCVVNAKGVTPSPCGGGVNASGVSQSSIWISSNPPTYGKSLALPFTKGGGFKQKVVVSRFINDFDCAVVKCAIVTRSDHLNSTNRKADVIVPVKFKK